MLSAYLQIIITTIMAELPLTTTTTTTMVEPVETTTTTTVSCRLSSWHPSYSCLSVHFKEHCTAWDLLQRHFCLASSDLHLATSFAMLLLSSMR